MKPHARVDGARGRQAETQEVSRWHASVAPGKTTTAARCTATQRVVALAAGRRQRAGQPLGRGRMDNGGAQVIGARQKPPGRRWSPTGRQALGIFTGVALNPQWAQLWCPQQAAA